MTIDMILIEPERYLDLSTKHITDKDNDLINEIEGKFLIINGLHMYIITDYDYVHMIKIPGYDKSDNYRKGQLSCLKRAGFSKDFLTIVRLMFFKKCDRLCLDCDGPVYDSLSAHDW